MIADDIFAGAGGWDVAAQSMGIHARGIENMKEARATREAAGLTTIHDDVWTYQPDGTATGLIASPPCQTFSKAGKGNGAKALSDVLRGIRDGYCNDIEHLRFLGMEVGDERTALVLTPLHFALTGGYEWLAWEQVDTVLPVWEACADALRARGWNVWTGLLYSEQYGVPQTRKRAFLLASRHHAVSPPVPTRSRYYSHDPERLDGGVAKWFSMAESLSWDPLAEMRKDMGAGMVERHGDRRPRLATEPSFTVTGSVKNLMTTQAVLRGSNHAHAAIRRADQPAPTIMFGRAMNDVRWYPEGETRRGIAELSATRSTASRRVTVSEAGVLQSFSVDHPWQGTKSKQYLQVGNAVPPLMAAAALGSAAHLESSAAA